jgi:hypothetical protein
MVYRYRRSLSEVSDLLETLHELCRVQVVYWRKRKSEAEDEGPDRYFEILLIRVLIGVLTSMSS